MSEWQPIETAPAGQWILTYADWDDIGIGVSKFRVVADVIEEIESISENAKGLRKIVQERHIQRKEWDGSHHEPSHWMPLPEPPK